MAQRKKKQSKQSIQKVAQAQHKNEFLGKAKSLLLFYLKPQLFQHIPNRIFDFLYQIHYNAPIIDAAPGQNIPTEIIKISRMIFNQHWKQNQIPLIKDGPTMSVYNCFTVWMTIWAYWNTMDEDFPHAGKIKETLTPYMDIDEKLDALLDHIYEPAQSICLINTDMGVQLYWMKFTIVFNETKIRPENRLEIYCQPPERRNITIDGNNRPIVRVGWWPLFAPEIAWLTMDPTVLNINTLDPEKPIDIYIQSHALQRLRERLDSMDTWLIHLTVYYSLLYPVIVPSGFGYPLIEYRIGKIRSGYFTFIIVEGILLIRTFLFITNNGTPEGKKLQEVTGLGRLDKKYLAIDRISAFISSDIGESEKIKDILTQCNCENLIHLNEEINKPLFLKNKSSQRTAQLIERYLQKPDNWEELKKRSLDSSLDK
jgi:hypothetical protein